MSVNFNKIGIKDTVISRFQSNCEQAFRAVNDCFSSITGRLDIIEDTAIIKTRSGSGNNVVTYSGYTPNVLNSYEWTQTGNIVQCNIRLASDIAIALATGWAGDLPADVPKPVDNLNISNRWVVACAAFITDTTGGGYPAGTQGSVYRFDPGPTGWRFYTYTNVSTSLKDWVWSGSWRTDETF